MSNICVFYSSIPFEETIDGKMKYSQCLMFENNTKDVVPCANGWIYENDISHSIVSEVIPFTEYIFTKASLDRLDTNSMWIAFVTKHTNNAI